MRPPIVVVGFMGAGKTTVGQLLADRLGVSFADADTAIATDAARDIPAIFAAEGEAAFREREATTIERLLADAPGVLAVGGGALTGRARSAIAAAATVVWIDVEPDVAWGRVGGGADRPLAADEAGFRALLAARRPTYAAAADVYVRGEPAPAVVAASIPLAPRCRPGAIGDVAAVVGDRRAVWLVDDGVASKVPGTFDATVLVPGGERAKTAAQLEALWRALAGAEVERGDVVVAVGGGAVTDVAGFAAATFRRGVPWIAIPTTLVGQVDAAIGGKTAIDVAAKIDVGAFHLPETVIADPDLLTTLPAREWAAGFAEVVKTALLAGGPLWDLVQSVAPGPGATEQRTELVRQTAAYKARVVVEDPTERGVRAVLNLGHTIGHGIEAAAGYGRLLHGEAIAIGLVAALRISESEAGLAAGTAVTVAELLQRHGLPVRATGLAPEDVFAAMRGDKKRVAGAHRLVLLERPGQPRFGVAVSDARLRAAVESAL